MEFAESSLDQYNNALKSNETEVKHCDLRKKTKMTNLMRNEIIY
jgi:hypothetical protein